MSVETALYPSQLNTAWPLASDMVSEGDDHVRLLKVVDKTTWGNVAGAVLASHIELNYLVGVGSALQPQIDGKGSISGQTWTGTHVFPNTTTVGPLTPTIQGYLATVTSDVQPQINGKGAIAGQTWGNGTHDFRAGTLLATTRVTGDATENVATTAFVAATALSSALPGQSGNAGKFVTTDGASASWSYAVLTPVVITANATAAPGNFYIIATAGITLTIPATFNAKDPVGFGMSRGITSANVNWTTNKVKGRTPGTMQLLSQNDKAVCVFANATDGFMEAA